MSEPTNADGAQPQAGDDAKPFREDKGADYHIVLYISEEQCSAYLKFERMDPGCSLDAAVLQKLLDDSGIVYGVDSSAIKDLAEQCMAGQLQAGETKYHVAQGKAARHSEDGRIEFIIQPSSENVRFEVDKEETIDYKNTNLIQNVIQEQHLATIIHPQEPENGVNLYGNTLTAREGVPLKIKLGSNVTLDQDKIFAQVGGRFIQENEELSVNPTYTVRGDVDFTVGNINFIGSVQVQRDILDDFSVYGKEGVEIGGVVGAATVESDKDIILQGGMNGKGKGFVRASGMVKAKYFNEVTAVCREGAEIAKSIMNSTVKTKGRILCPMGSIIGGEVVALMGMDVGVVGSELGIETSIVSGIDYELEDKIRTYETQIRKLTKEIDRINRILGPILANKPKLMALSPEKKMALKGLLQQIKNYKQEEKTLHEQLEGIQNEGGGTRAKEIHVRKMLYSGVKVRIGKCFRTIKMEVKGPVRLKEDAENETVSISNLMV